MVSLRGGLLVWMAMGKPQTRAGEKNGARNLFPAFADERSNPVG